MRSVVSISAGSDMVFPMRFLKQTVLLLMLTCSVQASDALLNSLQPRGPVSDYANVIPSGNEQRLNGILTELRQKTGAEVAVVTLPSLDGGERADFANRLYERWGIGQRGKDNGVLILAAINDRQAQIEVGYGLEGVLNDALVVRILREDVFPFFKQQRYSTGLTKGTTRLVNLIAADSGVQLSGVPQQTTSRDYGSRTQRKTNPILSIIFIIGFIYMAIRHPRLLLLMILMSGRGGGRSSSN